MFLQCSPNQKEEQPREYGEEHAHWGEHKGKAIRNIHLKAWTQVTFLVLYIQTHHIHQLQPDDRQHNGKKDEET